MDSTKSEADPIQTAMGREPESQRQERLARSFTQVVQRAAERLPSVEGDEIRVAIETSRGRYVSTVKTRRGVPYALADAFLEAKTMLEKDTHDEELSHSVAAFGTIRDASRDREARLWKALYSATKTASQGLIAANEAVSRARDDLRALGIDPDAP